jgi:DNA-binding IclR family transcriptional regulator
MPNKKQSSLDNAFKILKLFSLDEPEMSVTEIAKRLEVSKSTAHRLLASLLAEEFVYQNPKNQLYSLGSSILSLANLVNSQIHIASESVPILNTIAENTRESTHLSIMEDSNTIVYIQTVKGEYEEGINGVVQLGMRKPMTESASGKVFLAYDEELQKEYGSSLYSLSNLLISIKKEGFFIQEMGKATEIAMPVLYKGQITAVLSITTNTKRIRAQRLRNQAIRYLEQGARKLETIIVNRKRGNSIANASG